MRTRRLFSLSSLVLLILSLPLVPACASDPGAAPESGPPVFFSGMGDHRRAVSTKSPEAQRWFDQGLVWAFAFNHDEAIRSFREAARLDPDCAMAWWGIALCNGPHINNPMMEPSRNVAAWDALQKAMARRALATPLEASLIDALSARYASPAPDDRTSLDAAYADAMRAVWQAHPDDTDVCTLYAESLMDLRPWDLWTREGAPQPGTETVVALLEHALDLDPSHPGANHLYIHAVEASTAPQRAVAAADRLRALVPASGHLVHMPAHIDVRTGSWAAASEANVRAVAADSVYRRQSPRQGFYNVYMLHNHHFLAFSSMMEGRRDAALDAARATIASVPESFIAESPQFADPFMTVEYDTLKRFGMWNELLAAPAPDRRLPVSTALWHFMRGVAWAAKHDVTAAEGELAKFRALAAKIPADTVLMINHAGDVFAIADEMLQGEIAYARGDVDGAVTHLREAVAREDRLRYMEPPEWMQPVRHALGAVLVSEHRYSEAEAVFRADLEHWPENGWSLLGLSQCLSAQGRRAEAEAVGDRLDRAWARAQVRPETSCLCVKAAGS